MSAEIPAAFLPLLQQPVVASLATVLKSGQPQVNPVWFDHTGGNIRVNSARGRAKDANMRARPQATVLIVDPHNVMHWIEIRGRVVEVTESGADAHIDALSMRYLGKPYPFRAPGEVRVTYTIKPERVTTMG
jgi:PPOX class probable F420-dependent enzyme